MSYRFMDIVDDKVRPVPVDCGTCPVNMSCAVGQGGNGFVFNCCHSAGFETTEDGKRRLLLIDCQKHNFEQVALAKECKLCPLCSGDIIEVVTRDISQSNRYVPTVHAKVPLATRVKLFREKYVEAEARFREEKKAR